MNRYVYMGIRNWYRIPLWAIDIARRNKWHEKFSFFSQYQMIRKMVLTIIRKGRVTVHVYGRENLPAQSGYILYSNHQGFFDGMALLYALEQPFHFLVMKEMENFPFVRYVMRLLAPVYMDRSSMKDSFHAIQRCGELAKNGENVLIFPEGTLEKQENELLLYKPGAFKAAYMAKVPVVPVVLKNSFCPFERKGFGMCEVEVHILKPMNYEQYNKKKTAELAEEVMEAAEAVLK